MEYGTSMSIYGGRAVEGRRGSRVAVAAATFAWILTCLALLLPRGPSARDREQLLQKLHGNIILRNDQAILSQTHYLYPPTQGSMQFAAQEWAGNAPAARDNLPQRSELLHRRPVVHPMGYYQNVPVWNEEAGAAYVDETPPATRFSFGGRPPPMIRQVRLPAAAAVESLLLARHERAREWGKTGLAIGLTNNAAAQYGAAYGAAFASTYSNLLARPATGRMSKAEALNRLQSKAAAQHEVSRPAGADMRTRVQVMLPAAGWRMPPLTRTGTAVVEQALMTPSEIQTVQKQAADTHGAMLDIMSATGGPKVDVSTNTGQPFGTGHEADPLQTAEGAVAEAKSMDMEPPATTSSLAELV